MFVKSIALTDRDGVYGMVRAHVKARELGVHLICGAQLTVASPGSALVASPLRRLVRLDVSSNKLTDAGLAELAAWPGLEHVAFLRIGNNRKVTATGYRALIDATQLTPAVLDEMLKLVERLKRAA